MRGRDGKSVFGSHPSRALEVTVDQDFKTCLFRFFIDRSSALAEGNGWQNEKQKESRMAHKKNAFSL